MWQYHAMTELWITQQIVMMCEGLLFSEPYKCQWQATAAITTKRDLKLSDNKLYALTKRTKRANAFKAEFWEKRNNSMLRLTRKRPMEADNKPLLQFPLVHEWVYSSPKSSHLETFVPIAATSSSALFSLLRSHHEFLIKPCSLIHYQ